MTQLGFVGLGNIGKPMALRLASAFPLTVYDIAPEPVQELVDQGATAAHDLTELVTQCDVICVMVRDDSQVRDVVDAVLSVPRADPRTVVLHSTVSPETPAALEAACLPHAVRVLDAPVSGGWMGAGDGRLAIMVGGSDEAFDHARPALERMGHKIVHAGAIGSGTQFKLARNLMHYVAYAAATEAQRLAEAAGLDLRALGEVVRYTDQITGGPGAIMHRDTTAPLDSDDFWYSQFEPLRILAEKDLGYAIDLAEDNGIDAPLARLARERLGRGLGVVSD